MNIIIYFQFYKNFYKLVAKLDLFKNFICQGTFKIMQPRDI